MDPWGTDFVVDPVLKCVISRGPDQRLQTAVPGHFESPKRSDMNADDYRRSYTEQGLISFVAGEDLTLVQPDGSNREVVLSQLTGATASQSPDRNRFLVVEGTKIVLLTRNAQQGFDKSELDLGITGGKQPNFSPDGLKFAFIASLSSGEGVAVGDVTTGVPAMVVTSTVASPSSPSLMKGNREVVFADGGLNIYRAAAAEASSVTTINVAVDGRSEADGANPSVSPDGKLVAYVTNAGGGDVWIRSTSESRKALVARGSFKEVAFGPTGQLLAITNGSALYVTTARPSAISSGLPMLVLDGVGTIKSLNWR
jgi:hypothetical protein